MTSAGRAWALAFVVMSALVTSMAVATITAPGATLIGAALPAPPSAETSPLQTAVNLPPIPDFPCDLMEPAVRRQFVEAARRVAASPRDAEANGRLGMLYHAYEFHVLAEPCYLRAVALAGDDLRWRAYLARVLLERGEWERCAGELDLVLAQRPDDVASLIYRADADRMRNRLDEALAGYRRVIEISPKTARAYCGAGRVLLRRGELTIAVGYLEEAIRLTAEYGTARYVLGQALRKLGRTEAAMQQLELAEQHRNEEPRVPDPLRQRLDALRTGAIDALHRGIDLLQQGQVEHAIALLEEAVRINPDLPEAHGQLGTALLKRGQLEHAEASLRRALNLDPNFVDALYNLGLIAHRRNNYSEAARHFALAVSIRPQHFDAHLGLGADLSRLGRTDEAIEHLRAAARLRPDDPRPYKQLGSALAALGRYEEAIRWLRDGVQRLPNDASIADRLAWILATCPQEQWRVSAEALRIAEAVCRRTNNAVPQALDTLAAALANLGRFEEAIAAAEQALQMARANDNRDLASEIEARLDRYRAGRPYRQPSP